MAQIKAVLFDMIGTTVLESDPETVNNCFALAFSQHAITIGKGDILKLRGLSKSDAIRTTLMASNKSASLEPAILQSFIDNLRDRLTNFAEHPEFPQVVQVLKDSGIKVGIGSGLPRTVFDVLYQSLGWARYRLDYVQVYEALGRGRPFPDMIFDMGGRLSVSVQSILKVGDTAADIEEGKNAGAITAAVLSGTQPEVILRESKPDFLLRSLADVLACIG